MGHQKEYINTYTPYVYNINILGKIKARKEFKLPTYSKYILKKKKNLSKPKQLTPIKFYPK
jgi:hypothetical protein